MKVTKSRLEDLISQLPTEKYQSAYDYLHFLSQGNNQLADDTLHNPRGLRDEDERSFEDHTGVDFSMFRRK